MLEPWANQQQKERYAFFRTVYVIAKEVLACVLLKALSYASKQRRTVWIDRSNVDFTSVFAVHESVSSLSDTYHPRLAPEKFISSDYENMCISLSLNGVTNIGVE